jgi:hypothetical protein
MKAFLLFLVVVLFLRCTDATKQYVLSDKLKEAVPVDSAVAYFPKDSLFFASGENRVSADSFVKKWFSETLFLLREPVLYNYTGDGEFVRLLWLRSFDNAVVVRVNRFQDTIYACIKELKAKSYDAKQQVLKDTMIFIPVKKWEEILSALQVNDFWDANPTEETAGKDGIEWMLESRINKQYHCIERWDNGRLASNPISLYLSDLMTIGNSILPMKSSR